MEHPIGHALAHINLAVQDPANSNEDALGGFLFHDVAVCAGAQRAFGIKRFIEHREDQDGRLASRERIFLSKSRPSGPLSEMSTTIKSGFSSSMRVKAELASSASPQTTRSGSRLISSAKP